MIATATTTLRSLNVTVNKLPLKVLAIKNFSHLVGPGYVITLLLTWMFCSDGLYKDSDPYISQPNASRVKIFKR